MMRRLLLIMIAAAGCGRHEAVPELGGNREATPGAAAGPARTISADADPCTWADSTNVARLLGPLAAAPLRGHDASNPEPAADGRACVYELERIEPGADARELVALELIARDAMAEQAASQDANALAARLLEGRETTASAEPPPASPADTGWDATESMPNEFFGRVGHLGVRVRLHTRGAPLSGLAADSVRRLAAIVRDRVPDVPFAASFEMSNNGSGDPCALLTRSDAESALGSLSAAPYRSNGDSPLTDRSGDGCSFYTKRHRVLTLKPELTQGRVLFRMQAAASRMLASPLGVKASGADTLDGPWDEAAAGIDGTLYFLKGDRMLTVVYRTTGLSETAALHLATLAITRMR